VRPLIHQLAPAQDEDAVGPADLAEPVSDDERSSRRPIGATAADAPHGPLNLVFGGAINGTGAVVQD